MQGGSREALGWIERQRRPNRRRDSNVLGLRFACPNLRKPASVNVLDGYGVEVDALEAADIDRPNAGRRARAPEGKDAAGLAEVISRDVRMKSIEREIVERGEQPEALWLNPMYEGSPPPADRTVADADVIQIGVDLEPNAAAMA